MKKISKRSPTRVDLAGGTLDLWPLHSFVGGAITINVAIDLWTTCEMEEIASGIEIQSDDLKKTWKFTGTDELRTQTDPMLRFYIELFSGFQNISGFRMRTQSDSPVGGGIGGSSSLLISCLKALHEWQSWRLPSPIQLCHWAHNIEARILGAPTGTQDYFPAVTGGINLIGYGDQGIELQVLPVANTLLSSHFMLVNTGKSHHSGLNNFDVLNRSVNKDQKVLSALADLKKVSSMMAQDLIQGDWSRMKEHFNAELEARLQLTPKFTSPEIEKLHEISLKNGAEAMKICGAGGGGCVMIWVGPKERARVSEACQSAGFQVMSVNPVDPLAL